MDVDPSWSFDDYQAYERTRLDESLAEHARAQADGLEVDPKSDSEDVAGEDVRRGHQDGLTRSPTDHWVSCLGSVGHAGWPRRARTDRAP